MKTTLEKINEIVSNEPSKWLEKAKQRQQNKVLEFRKLVANALGISINTPLNQINKYDLAKWIIRTGDCELFKIMYKDNAFLAYKQLVVKETINARVANFIMNKV